MDESVREEIRKSLCDALGETKVRWSKADLVPYTKDTYRIRFKDEFLNFPDFVVLPETTSDVQAVVKIAKTHKIPLIPKGGGSNRTGMLVPIHGGIVVDTIRMNKIIEINPQDLYVTAQSGVRLKDLEEELAKHGVALNQEQGSVRVATVGGSISTSAFSRKHQKYGTIADRVMSLEVVLADGSIMRTGPKVLYTSTGYRLQQLFVGAEGTLGIVTEATLRVEPLPEAKDVLLAFYGDFWASIEASKKLMSSPVTFACSEVFEARDGTTYGAPKGRNSLFYVGFEGTTGEVQAEKAYVRKLMLETGGVLAAQEDAERLLENYTTQWCGARAITGFEDALTTYVPLERMKEFYDKLWNEIVPRHGSRPLPGEKYSLDVGKYKIMAGRYVIPEGDKGWDEYQLLLRDVAKLATGLGGSISCCHGVGLEHRDNIELEYSPVALDAMRRIKDALDPDHIMNPGKKIPDRK